MAGKYAVSRILNDVCALLRFLWTGNGQFICILSVTSLALEQSCDWSRFWTHKICMMTSLNRYIFRTSGPLWGESIGGFPWQRPVTSSFDVFFDLRWNKWLSKQWKRRWSETPSRSLWRRCNGTRASLSNPYASLMVSLRLAWISSWINS